MEITKEMCKEFIEARENHECPQGSLQHTLGQVKMELLIKQYGLKGVMEIAKYLDSQ